MATLSFITYFDTSQRKFRIQDTTNYSGQGLVTVDITGVLKINTPRGIIYNNTNFSSPDVNPSVSIYSGWIDLPVNARGYIMAGTYTITYTIQDTGNGNAISTQSNTYSYSFIVPEISITQTVDGYNSTFTSTDSTSYGTYTSFSRTHTVTPPSGSPLSQTSNSNATISYPANIYSGIWTSIITSVLVYTQGDGLVINVTITKTETVTAYLNDMNVIRGYIQDLNELYETARANNRDMSYRIQGLLLKISTAYEGYDLALYYNDLATAYLRTVDIIEALNDYITITFPEEIVPFENHQGGASHQPVSFSNGSTFGVSINASQVITFGLATAGHGGFLPTLSGNTTDYFGGDGLWHELTGGGDVFKSDFDAYDNVRAITATNITNWTTAYGWGNHASAGYMASASYPDLVAIEALSGTSGFLKKTAANTWSLDTNTYLTGTKVDSFNTRTGAVTLTKADVEGVLTGAITTHTHSYQPLDSTLTSIAAISFVAGDIMYASGSDILARLAKGSSLQLLRINSGGTAPEWWTADYLTANQTITLSGDATGSGTTAITVTLTDSGVVADTYNSVTVNSKGVITAGTNPTTLAGYGITDALSTSHAANNIINSGDGTRFLADDATYKYITLNGATDTQLVFIDGTATSGDSSLTFTKATDTLNALNAAIGTVTISTELDFASNAVSIYLNSGNLTFKDSAYTKTLTELVSGATNYWTAAGSDIYFGTGTDKVGINISPTLAELEVNGHIIANNFDSDYLRYKGSNLLLGPNAGSSETGSGLLYIHNSDTTYPLIWGDFTSRTLKIYGDTYIPSGYYLNFRSATNRIYADSSNNLTFIDGVAHGGSAVTLTSLMDGTYNALVDDFSAYDSVKAITAANISTWNNASILIVGGAGTQYLANDGMYHTLAITPPADQVLKWDSVSNYYRAYTSKTEAGGLSSGGKFWTGTDNPTATTRLNYDGYLHATNIYSHSDMEVLDSSKGLILQAADATRYRIQVDNTDIATLTLTPL